MMSKDAPIRATVQSIVNGKHGKYAVAFATECGSVTFSLEGEVWQEDAPPEKGEIVVLSSLRKRQAGWRPVRVSEEN